MMINMKFKLEVGAVLRPQIRRFFDNIKWELKYIGSKATIDIEESKGFLESIFYVKINNIEENYANGIKEKVKSWPD